MTEAEKRPTPIRKKFRDLGANLVIDMAPGAYARWHGIETKVEGGQRSYHSLAWRKELKKNRDERPRNKESSGQIEPQAEVAELSATTENLPKVEKDGERELTYSDYVLEALKGTLKPIDKTYKNGEPMQFVEKGPGMFGLTEFYDNMKWAGIFTHLALSARYSLYVAEQLEKKGYKMDLQTILDGMLLSHTGRREHEDAKEHKKLTGLDTYKERADTQNELLGVRNLEENPDVTKDVLTLVKALANIGMYPIKDKDYYGNPAFRAYAATSDADHQITHEYNPHHVRFQGFFMRNFKFKGESANQDKARKRTEVEKTLKEIIDTRKGYNLGRVKVDTDLYQALARMTSLGMSEESDRGGLEDIMYLVLQDAETQAFYEEIGIDLKPFREETVPVPEWEKNIRYEYANYARDGIVKAMKGIYESTQDKAERDQAIDELFNIFPFPDAKKWLIPYYHQFYNEHLASEKAKSPTPTVVFDSSYATQGLQFTPY